MVCGIAYVLLGVMNYGNVSSGNRNDKFGAAGPWWAFYGDICNASGKRVCQWGKVAFLAAVTFIGLGYVAEKAAI
jgi:hypothetical protein